MSRLRAPSCCGFRVLPKAGLLFLSIALVAMGAGGKKSYDVPSGDATETLKRFAQQAGQQVVYPTHEVRGVRTNALKGEFTAKEGIHTLLAGTHLQAVFDEQSATFAVTRKPDPNAARAPLAPNGALPKTQNAAERNGTADEPIKLSPFVVDGSDDAGYAARSSLAGTRLKTPLADIGAQVSVFTPELMADLALTNPEEVFLYSTNVDSYLEWTPGGDIGENRGTFFIDRNNVSRGLGQLTNMREFFPTNFQTDGYNTGRVTIASGANSVLFGLGSPAGVSDTSLTRAVFRQSYSVSGRIDNFDAYRTAVDINQPIIKEKLALRLAGLNNNNHTFRPESPDRNKRLYVTTTIKPLKNTTLRWSGEWIERNASRAPMILPRDWISPWWDGGKRGFDNRGITTSTATNVLNSRIDTQGFGSQVVRNNKILVYRYGAWH